jgi:hypothetical protein
MHTDMTQTMLHAVHLPVFMPSRFAISLATSLPHYNQVVYADTILLAQTVSYYDFYDFSVK